MAMEGARLGLRIQQQIEINVIYHGTVIGEYTADLLANELVIAELKVARALAPKHEAQLMNYLKATPYEVGLLLNFGDKPEFRRRVLDNSRKGNLSWYKPRVF